MITVPTITDFGAWIEWVNEISGYLLGPVILLIAFSMYFLRTYRRDGTLNSFTGASFATMILSIILSLIPIVTPEAVTITIGLTLLAVGIRILTE